MRRLMLESVRKFTEHGVTPLGLDAGVSYSTLRAEEMMVPLDSSLRFFA
jgi:hypothetical protein